MLQKERGIRKNRAFLILGLWMLCHLVYLGFWGTQKVNYHVDEIFTFGLSNDPDAMMPMWPKWEEGKEYAPDSFLKESLSVSPENRFDYAMVWDNQKNDVHPPFYYVLIHTICSVFPGVFSKWLGLAVNFMLLLGMDVLLYIAAKSIFQKSGIAILTVVVNSMTLLSVNMALYLRMYSMMTACVVGIAALFLNYEKKKLDGKFYMLLFFCSVMGVMTQYYFLIYLFFLCFFFGAALLIKKRWKETIGYVSTFVCAGGTCLLLFPAMLNQIFGSGERGQEAFQNASRLSGAVDKIRNYYYILNAEVFGGAGKVFLVLLVLFLGYEIFSRKKKETGIFSMVMLFCSTVCYVAIVSVISPYVEDRYIMATGPVWILMSVWMVYTGISRVWKRRKEILAIGITAVVFAGVIVSSMYRTGWKPVYTYQDTRVRTEIAKEYQDCRVLYLINNFWVANDNLVELEQYKSYTFLTPKNLWDYLDVYQDENIIVYNESKYTDEEIIEIMMKQNKNLEQYEVLYQNHAETIMHFE